MTSNLQRRWARRAKPALANAVALARTAILEVWSGPDQAPLGSTRVAVELERLRTENAWLREELRIKDTRLARIPARERPYYDPVERFAIVALRAATGWSRSETARRFLLTPATIAAWMRRLDEDGPAALVQTSAPVNRFPHSARRSRRSARSGSPTRLRRLACRSRRRPCADSCAGHDTGRR